jgi:hypothetical protein
MIKHILATLILLAAGCHEPSDKDWAQIVKRTYSNGYEDSRQHLMNTKNGHELDSIQIADTDQFAKSIDSIYNLHK